MSRPKIRNILSIFFFLLIFIYISCSEESNDPGGIYPGGQIIADHTVVDLYDTIPQEYIDIVKTWFVDAAGESHGYAYRSGVDLLDELDNKFQVYTFVSGYPELSNPPVLRFGQHGAVGEEDFWTNDTAIENIKSIITNQHDEGNPIHVILQAWCWDFTRPMGPAEGGTNTVDPEYGCHWFGSTEGGPEGNHIWGLDDSDFEITGNSLSLQSYLDVIDEYRAFCRSNGYDCVPMFTTGPVDGGSYGYEQGYQRYVKHEYLRNHVKADPNRVLFDYADILCYNDSGVRNVLEWTDTNDVAHTFQGIHPDNLLGGDTGHIGNNGALRLGKAMWWMLARLAGWDGN